MSDKLQALDFGLTFELAKKDPYTFITEYCYTVDEHGDAGSKVKKFPKLGDRLLCPDCGLSFDLDKSLKYKPFAYKEKHVVDGEVVEQVKLIDLGQCPKCQGSLTIEWAYLKAVIDAWKISKRFVVPKTRQMMLSWTMILCHLWVAIFEEQSLVMFQSKTEDKAKELIKRLTDAYNHLPEFIKDDERYGKLLRPASQLEYWFSNGSRIKAVPKGAEQATSFTVTAFLSDESAYQDDADKAYAEVNPTLGRTGRYTSISTPNGSTGVGGFFYRLVHDMMEGDV